MSGGDLTWAAQGELGSDVMPYLNYGVLGLLVIGAITGLIWFKPTVDRMLSSKDEVLAAKDESIARLERERDRLITERDGAEEQRDAAIAVAQEKVVPLLVTFVSTTQTLIPLLQEIVRESGDDRRR